MPTYEYACTSCHHEWEQEQSIKEDPIKECPQCHERKLPHVACPTCGTYRRRQVITPA